MIKKCDVYFAFTKNILIFVTEINSVTYKVTEEHSPKYIINTEKQNKWFMTKWFGNFLFSENRNEYIRIAFEYNSTPWRVYNLAHRSKARSRKEERILMELKEKGIITVIRLF